jgi:predicted dehydrogenase
MSKPLNVAAIGIGGIWNAVHAPAWELSPDAQVIATCDLILAKAKRYADAHAIKHVSTDYREVLKLKEVDMVDICTSNKFHSEIAVAALEAGKHVFCEKPDAINAAEAQRMADAAQASGKLLMTMRNNRFLPAMQFLKKYADGGNFGEIYTGRCGWIRRRGIPGKGGWFTTKELSGGGPLIDLGVHMIDLALWLMGSPKPVAVVGSSYCKFAGSDLSDSEHSQFGETQSGGTFDVEDLATGFVKFANGASLQIEFSWASNIGEEQRFVELRGSKAGCQLRNEEVEVYTEMDGTLVDIKPRFGYGQTNGHGLAIEHFIDCVLGRSTTPTITPQDGVYMIQILTALYESARTGREVRLDEATTTSA